ncbi:MAG: hypothetical protein WC868_11675, partial [Bacteroidales bacterium]
QQVETLESEVKAFAESLPYWAKFLSEKLLSGTSITENDIDTAYSYLLEDTELKEKTERPEITISYSADGSSIYKADLLLSKLQGVEGVNALAENQIIEFSPNVTIVYGGTGAGKSGYTRLLNKVFISRGDKIIRPNIYKENGHKPVNAEFYFQSAGATYPINFSASSNHSEFQQFSVFDGKSVLQHLENANQYEFRPAGLNFFADFTELILEVEEKLNTDIKAKTSDNIYPNYFDSDSEIKTLLQGINSESDITDIKKHSPFSEADNEQKGKLTKAYDELLSAIRNKAEAIRTLNGLKNKIAQVKRAIIALNNFFSAEYLTQIQTAITDCINKEATAKQEGIENFKSDNIKNIGSPQWKTFIEAAEKFAKQQVTENETYPKEDNHCLLCQQPLSEDAQRLILSYWTFLKSQAEQAARDAQASLDRIKTAFEKLNFDLFPDENVLTVWLTNNHLQTLNAFKEKLQEQKNLSANIISDIANKTANKREAYQISIDDLDTISNGIDEKIKSLNESDQTEELGKLRKALTYLLHKEKLQLYLSDIETYINKLKWIAKANTISWQGFKRKVTEKEKALSKKYFSQAYIDSFEEECRELEGEFGIEIHQTGGGGISYRQLFLKGNNPSHILSDGEQKVIALADFISEIKLSKVNRGIIFDDPVSSLDDDRKSIIARRLVKESYNRQVIIFTHDLIFVSCLIGYCNDSTIAYRCHWIEKLSEPGKISLDNTPSHEAKYKKSGEAQKYYKLAKDAAPEERQSHIKNGFAALRSSYEAFVIFELFGSVVKRFDDRVSVDALKDVYFDEAIVKEVMNNFKLCCRYMEGHIHSDKVLSAKPKIENFLEEIQRFDAMKPKLDELKKQKRIKK